MRKFKNLLFASLCVSVSILIVPFAFVLNNLDFMICSRTDIIGHVALLQVPMNSLLSIWDTLAKNWHWIVVGISSLILIISLIVLIHVHRMQNSKKEKVSAKDKLLKLNEDDMAAQVEVEKIKEETETAETEKVKEEAIEAAENEWVEEEIYNSVETPNIAENFDNPVQIISIIDSPEESAKKLEHEERTQTSYENFQASDMQNSFQFSSNKSNDELLLKFIMDTEQNIKDIKNRLENQERNEAILKQAEQNENYLKNKELSDRLDKIEDFLSKNNEGKIKSESETWRDDKLNSIYKELSIRLDRAEEFFKEQNLKNLNRDYDNNQEQQIRAICKEISDRIDKVEESILSQKTELHKTAVDERQDVEFRTAFKNLSDRLDKTETLINSKTDERPKVNTEPKQEDSLSIYKALDERLDRVENLFKEQNEKNLKREIEQQQKELDKAKQDMLLEKIAEKLTQEKSVSIDELLSKLIARDEPKLQVAAENNANQFKEEQAQDFDIVNIHPISVNKNRVLTSKEAVVIEGVQKLTLKEAYEKLPDRSKKYFDMLKMYAGSKPYARAKEAKTYLNIGIGNKLYVQLSIKKNTVVACFALESEELLMLRLNGKSSVKPEQTKIKVVDMDSYETATKMIDIRVDQVAREIEIVNNLRREKQKKRYEDSKRS